MLTFTIWSPVPDRMSESFREPENAVLVSQVLAQSWVTDEGVEPKLKFDPPTSVMMVGGRKYFVYEGTYYQAFASEDETIYMVVETPA